MEKKYITELLDILDGYKAELRGIVRNSDFKSQAEDAEDQLRRIMAIEFVIEGLSEQ